MVTTVAGMPVGIGPNFLDIDQGGNVVLATGRREQNNAYMLYLVADVDGPVRSAMMFVMEGRSDGQLGCALLNEAANEGRHLYKIYGDYFDATHFSTHQGAIGGSFEELRPPVLAHYPNEDYLGWDCGANYVVKQTQNAVLTAYPWDMSQELSVTSAATDPDHLHAIQILVRGDAVFWTTATSYLAGINVWDATSGMRPFIRWPGDPTHGAGSLGTDGIDMVWLQGDKPAQAGNDYPNLSFWTAAFTTDPAALQPRRLRSDAKRFLSMGSIQVGCGFAALNGEGYGVEVVRVSDGWGWLVPETPTQNFEKVLGVTCDELFVDAIIAGKSTVARIRLDSLGPGLPPD